MSSLTNPQNPWPFPEVVVDQPEATSLNEPAMAVPPITGYRALSHDEISIINSLKDLGVSLGAVVESMRENPAHDARWVSIGATHLQQGLMALTRAVARPNTF